MRTVIGGAAVAACLFVLSGCLVEVTGNSSLSQVEAEESFEVPCDGATGLAIEANAGAIDAGPGDRAGVVVVRAVKRAPTEEDLARIHLVGERRGDDVFVGYRVDGDSNGTTVSFTVTAPAALRARFRTGAGSIRAEGFESGLHARTGAGSVETIDLKGDQDLESGAGSIRLSGAEGRVLAKTGAGSIRASGRIRGASSLESSAGSIEVHLPSDARLAVSGKTAAGSVRTDFDLAVKGKYAAKEVSGTLGDGGEGSLRIESSAGSLSVLKQ